MMMRTRKFVLIGVFFIGAQASASLLGDLVGDMISGTVAKVGEGVVEGCARLVSSVIPSAGSKEPKPIQPTGVKLMDSLPEGSAEKVYQVIRSTPFGEIFSLEDLQNMARPGDSLYTAHGLLMFHAEGDFEMREIPPQMVQYFVAAGVITNVQWQISKDLAFQEQ